MSNVRQLQNVMHVVLIIGITVSVAGGMAVHWLVREIHHKEFVQDAMERFEAIQGGMRLGLNVVQDLSGLFAASEHVDRDEFSTYVRPILARQKGLQAISWNIWIPGERRAAFEAEQAMLFPGFRVTERAAPGRMVPAGERDAYLVVHYLEPLIGNERAFGFDVASDPVRRATFMQARDSGRIAISPRLVLAQESGKQFGALIVQPIHHKRSSSEPEGFAVGVIRFGELIDASLAGLSPRGISFRLDDVSIPSEALTLYYHVTRLRSGAGAPRTLLGEEDPAMQWARTFAVANRQWRFIAVHHHETHPGAHLFDWSSVAIPLIGLFLTGLSLLLLRRMQRDERDRQVWENAMRESEAQKRVIIDHAPFGIVVVDDEERILEFNRSAEGLFGYTREEVVGKRVVELVPPAMKTAHETGFRRYRDSGESHILGKPPFETEGLRKNGAVFPIRLAVNRVVMNELPAFLGVIIDMTDEKRLLAELIQSEKMAGLGNMVAGVAHEINTPVGIGVTASSDLQERIQAFVALVEREGISEEELKDHLAFSARMAGLIRLNLERAAELVRSFKAVAVEHPDDHVRLFRIGQCVESAIRTLHHELRGTRLLVSVECPEHLEMRGHPGALSQIVINLINNSLMHGYDPGASGRIMITCVKVGDRLYFTYSDDGKGMSEEVRQHIFEPFFTTLRHHGGTGLGMHVVYNLVTRTLRGAITCVSSVGQGAQFLIRIPLGAMEKEVAP
ncbi:MAG: CHASE domain-containing protein [Magnetococcales bacterium]|nr:CHASE domain-containing protein [Magnetococcales bacterium]